MELPPALWKKLLNSPNFRSTDDSLSSHRPTPHCLQHQVGIFMDLGPLTVSLLQKLCKEESKSFVFSPLSLATCLGMAAVGLKGESKTQVLELLKAPNDDDLHVSFKDVLKNRGTLKVSNQMLVDEKNELREEAKTTLDKIYRCNAGRVDFSKDATRIAGDVNAWAARKTKNKISSLLSENEIKPKGTLFLLNTAYFTGLWDYEFKPFKPFWWFQRQRFQLRNGEKVRRDFMCLRRLLIYHETDRLRAAALHYKEDAFRLIVAIPRNSNDSIDEVIAGMSTADVMKLINDVHWDLKHLILRIPKFKIEYSDGNLKEHLKQLGLSKMFTQGECDLGNLFSKVEPDSWVSGIIHKASFQVEEAGSEATAPQNDELWPYVQRPDPHIEMFLDRPFCFWVVYTTNVVVFAGICADP